MQNSDLQRVSWGPETPISFSIHTSVPEKYRAAIQAAADRWNTTAGRSLIKILGVSNGSGVPSQDAFNVIYWMSDWDTRQTNEQARTTIYWVGARIYEADIRVNARDHRFFWSADPEEGKLDVESLLVHEFGHAIGLSHPEEKTSVMVKALAVAGSTPDFQARRTPTVFDANSIRCEY